jgi:hypothetical protein
MSDIVDLLAGIKQLLLEQAQECAQHAKYEEEQQETLRNQREESDAITALAKENLEKIIRKREEGVLENRRGEHECEFELNWTTTLPRLRR